MDTFFHLFSPFLLFLCGTIRLVVYTPLLLVSSVLSPLHIPANYLPLSVSTSLPKCRVLLHIVFRLIFPGPYIDILSYPRVSSFFLSPHTSTPILPPMSSFILNYFFPTRPPYLYPPTPYFTHYTIHTSPERRYPLSSWTGGLDTSPSPQRLSGLVTIYLPALSHDIFSFLSLNSLARPAYHKPRHLPQHFFPITPLVSCPMSGFFFSSFHPLSS